MKTTILTIAVILGALAAKGQTKIHIQLDTTLVKKDTSGQWLTVKKCKGCPFPNLESPGSSGVLILRYPFEKHLQDNMPITIGFTADTVAVFFKEVKFVIFRDGKYVDAKPATPYSELMEFWQDGYMVPYMQIHRGTNLTPDPDFLYADKTKVKNHIVYYFEK